jgi:hypothetical protein
LAALKKQSFGACLCARVVASNYITVGRELEFKIRNFGNLSFCNERFPFKAHGYIFTFGLMKEGSGMSP